ncbi:Calx-beta domain-containing protein [Candidatus Parabeggiatoa sp. HSG14]|uniref:Calx-beta domain-containing protein n=1 Tax=Candidatus Parabeggiatoa sp. HSG14 TaxID=3055593 RepID=UPI0025A80202|nr:Calx-beta domain-containing protein [Thiotrichales bacterium HSG14]
MIPHLLKPPSKPHFKIVKRHGNFFSRTARFIDFITIFAVLILAGQPLQAAEIATEVLDKITTTGQAQVIISLHDPVPIDAPNFSDCDVESHQIDSMYQVKDDKNCTVGRVAAVAIAQDYVFRNLPAGSFELKHQYSHVPALAGIITQAALNVLENHPQVFSVYWDRKEKIQLADSVPLIKADQVHALIPTPYTGQGITIAVLDTGIDTDHQDFPVGTIVDQKCYTQNWCPPIPPSSSYSAESLNAEDDHNGGGHGSHVAGIITSPLGVAPDAKIIAVKVCDWSGSCDLSDSIAGLNWVHANLGTQPVQIVNMSLGGGTYNSVCDTSDQGRADAIDLLVGTGVTVFAASGNSGESTNIMSPACINNTIAVGATYENSYPTLPPWSSANNCDDSGANIDQIACFSNSNSLVDIVAPGAMIASSDNFGTSVTSPMSMVLGGTSQAAPTAAGVAALMLEANSSLTPTCIKTILKNTGTNVTDSKNGLSFPRIDALNAVNMARQTLQFSAANYSVNENGNSITINVTRTGGSYGIVNVDYATADGTATAGSDYTSTSGTLTWNDGDTADKTFTVNITNENDIESDETITLNLSNATGVCLEPNNPATLTVVNDDPSVVPGTLQFSTTAYSVSENGVSITISVTRTGGGDGAISVDYATSDGSATTADSDYTSVSDTLNWIDAETTDKTFIVNITNDSNFEGDENFQITLSNPTGGAGLGTSNPATVTITNDDPPPPSPGTLQFSTTAYNVSENGTSLTIAVTRTGGSDGAISVDYATSDGLATTADSDYSSVSNTLNWIDTETTDKTFIINITDDSNFEGDENFQITLSNPTGGTSVGTPATVTILDDEIPPLPASPGRLQFSTMSYSVNENSGSIMISVIRTGGSDGTISVNYTTVNGSANNGSDYTGNNGRLSWGNGDVAHKTFTINIMDDNHFEGNEHFRVMLSNTAGSANIGTNQAFITINDDEIAPSLPGMEPLPPTMGIFIEIAGSGNGKVRSDLFGINCASKHCKRISYKKDPTGMACDDNYCSYRFDTTTHLNLTATPDKGSTFIGWGGHKDCADSKLWMTGNKLCIAYFRRVE